MAKKPLRTPDMPPRTIPENAFAFKCTFLSKNRKKRAIRIRTTPRYILRMDTSRSAETSVQSIPTGMAERMNGERTFQRTCFMYLKKKYPTPSIPAAWVIVVAVWNGNSIDMKIMANMGKPNPIEDCSTAPTKHTTISAA